MEHLNASGTARMLDIIEPAPAPMKSVMAVHTRDYIEQLRWHVDHRTPLDLDTPVSAHSLDVALLAAGGLITGLEGVLSGARVFALIRPPGHHATPDSGMGFCLLNNPAIAAQHLLDARLASKVLIIDFDQHHGNGTQEVFYRTSRVLYISTHCPHIFPGTGSMDEVGEGDGEGFTVNLPMRAGSGDVEYARVYRDIVLPIALEYGADVVVVSAGIDIHTADPLGHMSTTERGIGAIASTCVRIADECCGGRVMFELEGGYNLDALAHSVEEVIRIMLSEQVPTPEDFVAEMDTKEPPSVRELKSAARDTLSPYWEL